MTVAEPTFLDPVVTAAAPSSRAEELSLRGRRGRVLLGTITAAHFAHHTSNSLLNPLLPLIRDTFAMSYAQSGFAVSAYALSLGFSNGPIGLLADRIGSRTVIAVGLVLTGVVSAALAQAGDYGQLLVLLIALGVISGTYHAPAAALIARSFSPRVRGAAMGFHITGGHLAFFAAPLLAAYLATATGTWRTSYLWFAIVPIVLGGLLWLVAAPDRRARAVGDIWAPFREIRTVMHTIGPLVSLSVAFQVGISAMFAFLALYLVDARGMAPALAATAFGFTQLIGVVGAPAGGWLSDRLGRRTPILISLALIGPSVFLISVVPNELLVLPLTVFGLAFSMRGTATEVLVMDTAPAERRGAVLGAYYLAAQPIGGIATPIFGAIAGVTGIAAAFSGVGLLLAAMSLVAVIAGRRMRQG
ncbi:MAG TPA: MFS transporter [Candidatus Limnocylindria bacterium]|nr:MFS transporter [Candidatus Limnocylindria bacterium]